MFSTRQQIDWNSLLYSFEPIKDDPIHAFDVDLERLLHLSVDFDTYSTTFLAACELWKRFKTKKQPFEHDTDTLLALILFITCEIKETWRYTFEDFQLTVRQLNPTAALCFFDKTQFRTCILNILKTLDFNLYYPSSIDQFQQCAFFDAPPCILRLVEIYVDLHKHDNETFDSETCVYQSIKLWYDFAVLNGYWRSDYITLFIFLLINKERICRGCILNMVGGDQKQYLNIVCYGHKIFSHLQRAFECDETLCLRYKFPKAWSNGIDDYFCDRCPTCEKESCITDEFFALRSVKKSHYAENVVDVAQFPVLREGGYGRVCYRETEKLCFKTFFDDAFCREVCLSLALNHRNILPMIECGMSSCGSVWMSTAYRCRDLEYRLNYEPVSQILGKKIMQSIGEAVDYMHRHCILHMDLKPSNILCSFDAEVVQLFDFSLSQRSKTSFSQHQYGLNPFLMQSLPYRAPELLFYYIDDPGPPYLLYAFAADMWALGAIFYQILQDNHSKIVDDTATTADAALRQIFRLQATNASLDEMNHYNELPHVPKKNNTIWATVLKNSNINAIDLIDSLLDLSPEDRKTSIFVVNHPYFSNNSN